MSRKKTLNEFLGKSIKTHGKMYDYSLSAYNGAKEKATIGCKIHGVYEQRASSHINGSGCPKCCRRGFDPSKKGFLYYFRIIHEGNYYWKIGITGKADIFERYCIKYDKQKIDKVLMFRGFIDGNEAADNEQKILSEYKDFLANKDILTNGNSEIFTKDILNIDSM